MSFSMNNVYCFFKEYELKKLQLISFTCIESETAVKQCFLTSVCQKENLSVISPVSPIQAGLYVTEKNSCHFFLLNSIFC